LSLSLAPSESRSRALVKMPPESRQCLGFLSGNLALPRFEASYSQKPSLLLSSYKRRCPQCQRKPACPVPVFGFHSRPERVFTPFKSAESERISWTVAFRNAPFLRVLTGETSWAGRGCKKFRKLFAHSSRSIPLSPPYPLRISHGLLPEAYDSCGRNGLRFCSEMTWVSRRRIR